MAKAAADAAKAADGGAEAVGNVIKAAAGTAAKGGDVASVNGIANGIKGIVEAAEKAGKEGKLNTAGGAKEGNENAGKLFAKKNNANGGGGAEDAEKAAAAVSAVSGEQILKAIVDAAKGDGEKKAVNDVKDAANPIAAAIGSSGEQNADGGEKGNEDAGKLFAKKNDGANGGGDATDAGKAAAAVSAVSGEQILKAIVDAAKDGEKKAVADVKDAENPIAAAIGSSDAEQNADAFATLKKDDQIAAAIVLRGMAKDGEFALTNAAHANAEKAVKNVVESEIKEISEWLEEMAKAAAEAAKAADGGAAAVGNVIKAANNKAAKGGEEASVNGIANGIKGIVEADEKAGEEGKLNAAAGDDKGNANAGKLFATKKNNQGGGAADAEKAAAAVSAVSGEQILKAIVDAAKDGGGKVAVANVKDAKNPIEAAIGSSDEQQNAAAFDTLKKDDQIAAAIVLRGMAKDGEFALKNDAHDNAEKAVKNVVESAVNKKLASG
ncbi:vls recombination cassette Vls5 (plasmid) [Borreliella garinii Far04]|uniref:variable large family protein n=1 Tax=Borreliella garinii TaxID=29519 RepID=UPI00018ACFBD|nr:variable large family protein [Borreliella garinii]ACL35067.1 vls recombination cassette Vls5 [Borreliella garinii Far04]